jgi:hypothetical protein
MSSVQNRIFFPQSAMDQWLVDGAVEVAGAEMSILAEARRYRIAEGVRVLREVTGTPDDNDLVGKVKSKLFLEELGAEILETSMVIGDNAYDVIPGWLGSPTSTWVDHAASAERQRARASHPEFAPEEPKTDEDLLARFLLKTL